MPLILLALLLLPQRLGFLPPELGESLIIWNVGQGQWVTLQRPKTCYHFDLGGEHFPRGDLKHKCGGRENKALFSHWDWDHLRLAKKAKRLLPNLCILLLPAGKGDLKKRRFLGALPPCSEDSSLPASVNEIHFGKTGNLKSNDSSRVFLLSDQVLNPGDSTKSQEQLWRRQLRHSNSIKQLILGHHGSLTSTSKDLLDRLPELKQAAVSARFKRYKHPHWRVEARLRRYGIALLRTEDWGNILMPVGRADTQAPGP